MHSLNRLKLKICGMRDAENIRDVAALHPDYMGFIFYADSKRFVGEHFQFAADFPSRIRRVGVFVNEATENIRRLVKKHSLNLVQLHGEEPAAQCRELRSSGVMVIKAFSMSDGFDFGRLTSFREDVDYFLFDTMGPGYGGTGKTFDWQLLKNYDQEKPFFLSGGLSIENLGGVEKIKEMNIHALDVNSGVETSPGMKDVRLIEKIQIGRLNKHWLER